ncbi:MAG TPA: retropepsin-like aspartic protease [Roseiflexaceae bacterium]|nr:retropepsin-like aspartic protease [Roseiflexaceae bacterium]
MVEDRTRLEFPSRGVVTAPLGPPEGLVGLLAAGPGGHALHVLIDTGTDPSAMDAGLARRAAVRTGGSGVGLGAASDSVAFTEAVLPWLRIDDPAGGALAIRELFAPALDLSGLPFRVDVVLGYTVLRQLALRIDYRRRTVTFAHPDLGLPPTTPGAAQLPLDFFEHFPALRDLEVDGVPIPLATIDTGSNAALTVGPDLAERLGLRPGAEDVTLARGAGFGGGTEVVRRRCGRLRIGPFTLPDVELDAHLGDGGDLSRLGRANLGNRLLARFAAITLDYGRRTLTLEQG